MAIKGGLTYKELIDKLASDASPEEKEMIYRSQVVAKAIKDLDLVEVVRCKDCRFFEDEDEYGNCYCSEWGNVTNANGYCHDSERKEKMSKNNNSTYLCNEYQDLIEIRRWCAIFGAVQLVSLILFAIACAL